MTMIDHITINEDGGLLSAWPETCTCEKDEISDALALFTLLSLACVAPEQGQNLSSAVNLIAKKRPNAGKPLADVCPLALATVLALVATSLYNPKNIKPESHAAARKGALTLARQLEEIAGNLRRRTAEFDDA